MIGSGRGILVSRRSTRPETIRKIAATLFVEFQLKQVGVVSYPE